MAKSTDDEIADIEQKIQDLNDQLKRKRARKREQDRKERNTRLIHWGIAVEQALNDPENELNEKGLAELCRKYLTKRSLGKALTGPLQEYAQSEGKNGSQNHSQYAQQKDNEQNRQQFQRRDQQGSKSEPPNRSNPNEAQG